MLVCRALVLVVLLVTLPLAAVTGDSLPLGLRSVWEALPRHGAAFARGTPGAVDGAAGAGRVQGTQRASVGKPSVTVHEMPQIEERLRALGAVHYRLEAWEEDRVCYRFECQMAPISSERACARTFEATDLAPLEAMRRVLAEVEAWRGVGQRVVVPGKR